MEKTGWSWGINVVLFMFPANAHKNVHTYFPLTEAALQRFAIVDPTLKVYAYATIRAETARFRPELEGESKYNTIALPYEMVPYGEERKYNLYEFRNKTERMFGKKISGLGNDRMGDGKKYMGRGFIQLTGKSNYLVYGHEIGMGSRLVEEPDLALQPKIAALVLAAYIRDRMTRISSALKDGDLRAARRAVNGGLNGLDEFEKAYTIGANLIRRDLRDLPNTVAIA